MFENGDLVDQNASQDKKFGKTKFEIEGKKRHKLIFTEKNIFYIKETTKRIEYKDIKEIKLLYKRTDDLIATIVLFMFGIAGIVVVPDLYYYQQETGFAAGCLIVSILSFLFGIVYAWRILTKSIIQIETPDEKITFFSKKANEEKMEEAVRYAEIMRNKAFLEKMNEKKV